MAIDEAIDNLVAALEPFGVAAPQPPSDLAAVEAIERAIAPLTLPADLRRLWERVDPRTLRVSHGPRLCPPDFALEGWKDDRWLAVTESTPVGPPNVLMFGYQSWDCLGIDLDSPGRPGGSIWQWDLGSDELWQVFPDLTSYVESTASLLRAGGLDEFKPGDSDVAIDDMADDNPFRLALMQSDEPGNSYERSDDTAWPEHWRQAQQLDWSHAWAHGATHTIAQLVADRAEEPRGRIHAEAIAVDPTGATISDGTGELRLEHDDTHFTPTELRQRFEFDLTLEPDNKPSVHDGRPLR